jgi:hypothetical protein
MRKRHHQLLRVCLPALTACSLFATHALASGAWSDITAGDLTAIHQLLLDNHPGPVDSRNPAYRVWLETGFRQGLEAAKSAQNYFDYKRAVLAYINGFRDGHTNIAPAVDTVLYEWPGFLPAVAGDGKIRVGLSEQDGVTVGDEIVSCDGVPIGDLFEKNVAPYYWNRDIPQGRDLNMPRTLMIDAGDDKVRVASCVIAGAGGSHTVQLQWRRTTRPTAIDLRAKADGRVTPPLGLRKIDGIWFLSLPSFDYQSGADVVKFKAVLDDVAAHAKELQAASRVVIDVRNNRGGMSVWGRTAAGYLWGDKIVEAVNASLPSDVDWRASKSNLQHVSQFLEDAKKNGLPADSTAELTMVRDLMIKGLAQGTPLVREPGPATPLGKLPPSQFKGTVYFLTDEVCTSACLNFADVVLRLPHVVHVGRPTDADALYIDLNSAPLPSGFGIFQFSQKVFRTGVRGNNQWYEPKYKWPGGVMSDDAVAHWIASLPPAPGAAQ